MVSAIYLKAFYFPILFDTETTIIRKLLTTISSELRTTRNLLLQNEYDGLQINY